MNNDYTVVICCAGMGTRLGIGTTKALLDINGKPLIIRQLELLDEYDDIRIVVGYQANRVIDIVNSYRRDIMFAFNYEYDRTGVADSLEKAMLNTRKYVIAMDGDVLINPDDFLEISSHCGEFICYNKTTSTNQIYVNLDNNGLVHGFTSQKRDYEWSGIACFEGSKVLFDRKHVYELLENILPTQGLLIRSRDIDTIEDYENALDWCEKGYID